MNTTEKTPLSMTESALAALAEDVCPLVGRLTAALCKRPSPAAKGEPEDLDEIIEELDRLLEEDLPEIEAAAFELVRAEPDDIGEILDDIEDSSLNFLGIAAKIWKAPLGSKAEGLRPLLAALAERPVVELVLYLQFIVKTAVLAWQTGCQPQIPPDLEINVNPPFKDIAAWQKSNPGVIKAEVALPD